MIHIQKKHEVRNCPDLKIHTKYIHKSCEIENGQIILDLYRKPTDRNMYLMLDSCHPPTCQQNIPFSLGMRINIICSKPESRKQQFEERKELLLYTI